MSNGNQADSISGLLRVIIGLIVLIILMAGGLIVYIIVNDDDPPEDPTQTPDLVCRYDTLANARESLDNSCQLNIAVGRNSAPFTSDVNDEPDGYEVDILNAIAEANSWDFEFVFGDFPTLEILIDNHDIVAGAYSGTTDRCGGDNRIALCTLSNPHFEDNFGVIIRSEDLNDGIRRSYVDAQDFCNEFEGQQIRVVIVTGTVAQKAYDEIKESCPNIELSQEVERGQAIDAIENNEADVYITDYEILAEIAENDENLRALELEFLEAKPDPYVFMLSDEDYQGLENVLIQELEDINFEELCTQNNLPDEKC